MNHLFAWSGLALLLLASTFVGDGIARAMPWRSPEHERRLRWPLAAALAPFLLGLLTVVTLLVADGASSSAHLGVIGAVLLLIGGVLRFRAPRTVPPGAAEFMGPRGVLGWSLAVILAICVCALLYLALALPLTENDSLEYGLVGRAIYEAHSLRVYPLLDPDQAASGFFAPWTHPPLYTSLIYLTYVLEGSAEHALLMKFLAPWFMLTAAWGVFALGRLHGPNSARVAALLFMTTPLLSVGAQTAAIDALPVAGMVLMMLALIGFDPERRSASIYTGLLVGLALWTHSQAILYIPILVGTVIVSGGLRAWRSSAVFVLKAIVTIACVAAFPYFRNLAIYGSVISDNPVVFALPSLDWDSYFKYARSIYDWSTRLQYGVLKGLLSLRSFGLLFWIGLVATAYLFFSGTLRRWLAQLVSAPRSQWEPMGPTLVSLCICGIYFAGVLLSLAVGTDLMVKNDRYLLVLVPAVSLVAACGWTDIFSRFWSVWTDPRAGAGKRHLTKLTLSLSLAFHASVFLLFANLVQWGQLFNLKGLAADLMPRQVYGMLFAGESPMSFAQLGDLVIDDPAENVPGIGIARNMNTDVPSDKKVLAIRPADMFYTERRMVSYLDPRMVPVYGERDPARFVSKLKELGIEYVQAPNYFIPPVSNSALMAVLAQPELATLVRDVYAHQLYRLTPDPHASSPGTGPLSMDLSRRTWVEYPSVGTGRLSLAFRSLGRQVDGLPYSSLSSSVFLPASYSHTLELGGGQPHDPEANEPIAVEPGGEYTITLDVEGDGFIRIWVSQLSSPDVELRRGDLMGDFALSSKVPGLKFQRRFRVMEGARYVRIAVQRLGISRLTVKHADLRLLKSQSAR
ncbi:MAG: glycosyltransferase family 39 protein [Hydrogenophaga sp.]|nr:glycosyltransferase family 39 protein [Hydrogenophaga sp.]